MGISHHMNKMESSQVVGLMGQGTETTLSYWVVDLQIWLEELKIYSASQMLLLIQTQTQSCSQSHLGILQGSQKRSLSLEQTPTQPTSQLARTVQNLTFSPQIKWIILTLTAMW
uniref:Uncharacterized protein n=1 Tax=uncultured marine virus TaxID=186617 RepID=A0A0F7L4V7_9VIRU|nr:hypothetical protein [uncultured marine virus]